MKTEILAAFVKRFNFTDNKIKTLHDTFHESVTGQNRAISSMKREISNKNITLLDKEIAHILSTIPENKNEQFAKELADYKNRQELLEKQHNAMLLQEPAKAQKGKAGRGIEKIFINAKKDLIIAYTDGTRTNLGKTFTETVHHHGGGGGLSKTEVLRLIKPNIKLVDSSVSPFPVPADTQIIEVTVDEDNIDLDLSPLSDANFELIIIRNDIGPGTAILDVIPNGSEKLKEPGTGTLLDNKNIVGDGSSLRILPVNATHWYIT